MATIDDLKKRMAQSSEEKVVRQPLLADEARKRQQWEEQQQNKPIEVEHTIETDPTKIAVAKEVEAPKMDFERMAQITDPNRPLSPQEQEKLDKRRRNDAIFSALGDGLSALSNLYFTSQGAYDMSPAPSQSLSAKSKERWDRIKAERDAKDLRFFENVQRRQAERQKREDALKQHQAMMEWRNRNSQDKAAYNMAENERKAAADKAKAEEAKRVNDARIANYNSQIYKRAMSGDNKYYTMPIQLSDGEIVDVEARILKDRAVVNKLFNYLPEADRLVAGSKDSKGNHKSPTLDEMMRAVFDALPNNPDMQAYLRELSQEQKKPEPQKKQPNPMGASSKKPNPMS